MKFGSPIGHKHARALLCKYCSYVVKSISNKHGHSAMRLDFVINL